MKTCCGPEISVLVYLGYPSRLEPCRQTGAQMYQRHRILNLVTSHFSRKQKVRAGFMTPILNQSSVSLSVIRI